MDTVIPDLINFFMIIIPIGAAVRIGYCLILISSPGDDEQTSYKKRAKNALMFALCSEVILSIIMLVGSYY